MSKVFHRYSVHVVLQATQLKIKNCSSEALNCCLKVKSKIKLFADQRHIIPKFKNSAMATALFI